MQAKWVHEVRALLEQEVFRAWLRAVSSARESARESAGHYEELLAQANLMEFRSELTQKNAIDTLYRAGEYEDTSAGLLAEASVLENESLELVGAFEQQRLRTSELWSKVQAHEYEIDEARRVGAETRAREIERVLAPAREEYQRETEQKQRLWAEVEEKWAASFKKNLSLCEQRTKGGAVRRQAERLFAEAEALKHKAAALSAEAEEVARACERREDEAAALVGEVRARFDGYIHEDFIYWPQRENQRAVYVVPLQADLSGYNLDLEPGALYQCDRGRGVEFMEPVVDTPAAAAEDHRLEQFFCEGRPRRPLGPPSGD